MSDFRLFKGVARRLGANCASLTFCGFDDVIAALGAESATSKANGILNDQYHFGHGANAGNHGIPGYRD